MPGTDGDPSITIGPVQLQVEPGGQVRTTVTVRNQGQIVDGFRLTVLGDGPPGWAQIDPSEVRALPGETARATITFTPPGGTATVGGAYPFGVLATSTVDASRSAAAEGDLEVGALAGVSATLKPRLMTGRWHARFDLTVANQGNRPARLRLTTGGADAADEHLAFLLMPATLTLPVGGVGHSRLRVRVRRPRLRGGTTRLPFQIRCQSDDVDLPETSGGHVGEAADAVFVQRPILSRLVTMLAVLTVAGVVAAVLIGIRAHPKSPATGLAGGPPPTPSLTATLLAGDQVQLSWPAIGNVDTYKLLVPALNATPSLDGELTGYTVTGLHAATHYCFELRAVRGTQISGLANACVTTLPAPPVPASPSALSPTPSSATPASGSPTQSVVSTAPPLSTAPLASSAQPTSAALPVSAVASSPAPSSAAPSSAPVSCVPAGTAPGADTRSPQLRAGQWIAVDTAAVWPVSTDPQATQALSAAGQVTVTAGTVAVLDSKQLQLTDAAAAQESWFVYVGVFTSSDSANCFCQHQTWKSFCVPYPGAPAIPAQSSAPRS